jgi:hypothetical protein
MRAQERGIIPCALPDELLEGPHRPGGRGPRAPQTQGHRLHVLAGHIREQQATQVDLRPLALLPPLEERGKVRMVGPQLVRQVGQIVRCECQHEGRRARQIVDIQRRLHRPTPYLSVSFGACNTMLHNACQSLVVILEPVMNFYCH